MDTIHLVDTEVRHIVEIFEPFDPSGQSISGYRDQTQRLYAAMNVGTSVPSEEKILPGKDGSNSVRTLFYRASPNYDDTRRMTPAIVYLHGGGMVAGTPDMVAHANHDLAQRTGATVIAIQYRLAPETPFPGALEDIVSVLQCILSDQNEHGIDPDRVIIMGHSAGGGLAASAALMSRDLKLRPLAGQVLIYPMLDCRTGSAGAPTHNPVTGQFVHTRAANSFGWEALRGSHLIPTSEAGYFSPSLAKDMSGLPPTFIATGSLDLFLDEDVAYAMALIQAGVRTELHVYEGAVHGFDALPSKNARCFETALDHALEKMLR